MGDYFDYIKIEADSSEGKCAVDNSNLEEGVIPADSVKSADDFADSVSKIEGDVKTNYEVSYKLSKKINKVKEPALLTFPASIILININIPQ